MSLLIMFFIKRYKVSKTESTNSDNKETNFETLDEINSNTTQTERSQKERYLLIGLIAIFMSTYSGLQTLHLSFSSTYYQLTGIKISVKRAAEILSVMSTTYTVGKVITAFISIKIKSEIIIIYHFVIICISMALLYFGKNNELMVWIGNGVIGNENILLLINM